MSTSIYGAIPRRREIIDRGQLISELEDILDGGDVSLQRPALLERLKQALEAGRTEIYRRLADREANGLVSAHSYSFLAEQILRLVYDITVERVFPVYNPTASERICLVATGGFGRGDMAPYSDIDLMFLVPYKRTPWVENVAEYVLYMLWDLGFKVGHATRSEGEAIKLALEDTTICTALLDGRFLFGDQALFVAYEEAFKKKVIAKRGTLFVDEKLSERDARHDRLGDTRYLVEPNLKEGKGGLRDLQTLFWIARFLYGTYDPKSLVAEGLIGKQEAQVFRRAEIFLWAVRCHLHVMAGRASEQLSFDVQRNLAEKLGYKDRVGLSGAERFMKHYYLTAKQVGDLTRVFCASLEDRQQKKRIFRMSRLAPRRKVGNFLLDGDRLTVLDENDFRAHPERMLEIFAVADQRGCDIHPDALRLISRDLKGINNRVRKDPAANKIFMQILTDQKTPGQAMRRMNEAGVFGRFMPDFGRVVAQMQHDMYHHYTVDEHTIRALELLARIEDGELDDDHPLSAMIVKQLVSRRVLHVAVLLHDIAKGRGGNHSELGADIALKLCPAFGLSEGETELVSWLVRHHLLMSNRAFKRDLNDPKTIEDFGNMVKSPERLKLLLVLTVVDIRAVGPRVWNGWKRQLLTELYHATEDYLSGGHVEIGRADRVAESQKAFSTSMSEWGAGVTDDYIARFRDAYWLSEDTDTHKANAELMRRFEAGAEEFGVALEQMPEGVARVSICTQDRPKLFAMLSGALAESGMNIVGAKIHTTHDGVALDNFTVSAGDEEGIMRAGRADRLNNTIARWLGSKKGRGDAIEPKRLYPDRTQVFKFAPSLVFDNKASEAHTVLEINARDRRGLLYDLTRVLGDNKVSILSAHISTFGVRAVDVFYIRELDGRKITNKVRLKSLERKLIEAANKVSKQKRRNNKGAA